jgi:hypothetical protein
MGAPFPPAWIVSALALLAALGLGLLSYMPRLIRLALVLPLLYFAGIYFYATSLPGGVLQVELVRFGLIGLFLSELITMLPYLARVYQARFKAWQKTWQSRKGAE